ncbi:hypothetical protein ACFPM0_26510 [Pseudonocardia sulfidoxydans]|uniref:hypothetical protein n=1 Tax=Pseudonocardia sulfidoxydans TaxID=54011 RepID=UPI00361358C2
MTSRNGHHSPPQKVRQRLMWSHSGRIAHRTLRGPLGRGSVGDGGGPSAACEASRVRCP